MTENNHNEKDELREFFAQFTPRMSDESDFIANLENRLSAVEDVREHHKAHYARMKKAVGIAAFFGFLIGAVLSLSSPLIIRGISAILSGIWPSMSYASTTISWIVISLATVGSVAAAYDLSLSASVQARLK